MPKAFDKFVCVELLDRAKNAHLYTTIVKQMMHGPCGNLNPKNMCMRKHGYCKDHYPKDFSSSTTQEKNSYPTYKRCNTNELVKARSAYLDSRWVILYYPYLLAKFDCHMNVNICPAIKAVKYLYKYIYKVMTVLLSILMVTKIILMLTK